MALNDLFTHQRSTLVDVVPNPRGEFVQVWNAPHRAERRRLLLTYLRTANGPTEIYHRIELDEGPFCIIETFRTERIFYYRDNPHPPRTETILPSGRILVSDPRAGFAVEASFTAAFDWEKMRPKGKALGDRAVMKLQSSGEPWVLTTFQRRGDQLFLVVLEEYRGHIREKFHEFGLEV